jgi:hypothetical protein
MPAQIGISIKDSKGLIGTTLVNIPTATTAANGITFAQNLAALVDAVIGGQIVGLSLCYGVSLPGGIKATPNANQDVEEGARFSFNTAANHKTSLRLPTFLETLILSGTKQVDLEDLDVDAFVDAMTAGLGGILPCDSRDEDVATVASAREQFLSDRG